MASVVSFGVMRRRLILMRHAKSSWKTEALTDHSRPLNARGQRSAPAVGAHLASLGWTPDLVLASDAQRTTSTAELVCEAMGATPRIEYARTLYRGGPRELVAALRGADDAVQTLLVLGHNPGWEDALTYLCGAEEPLKTADAALLEAEAETWSQLADERQFELITIVRARAVEGGDD